MLFAQMYAKKRIFSLIPFIFVRQNKQNRGDPCLRGVVELGILETEMDKLTSLWDFVRRRKYLITLLVFGVIIGFLDENSIVRRLGYYHEESLLRSEIEKYRKEYEENTERLNELDIDSGAIERIAREKYLMKKPNEDIFVFEGDITE